MNKPTRLFWLSVLLAFSLTSAFAQDKEKDCATVVDGQQVEEFNPNQDTAHQSKFKTLKRLSWEVVKYGTAVVLIYQGQKEFIPMLDDTERVIAAGVLGAVTASSLTSITTRLTAWAQQQNFVVYNLAKNVVSKKKTNPTNVDRAHIEGAMTNIYETLNGKMNTNASFARNSVVGAIRIVYDPLNEADVAMREYLRDPENPRNAHWLDRVYTKLKLGCVNMGEVYPDYPIDEANVLENVHSLFEWKIDLNRLYARIQNDKRVKARIEEAVKKDGPKGKGKVLTYYQNLLKTWFPGSLELK